jgi:hypothetical protein
MSRTEVFDAYRVPKSDMRHAWLLLGLLAALAAAILMLVGFSHAGTSAPDETQGPALETVESNLLPMATPE